jgi:hypothetical protein
LDTCISASSLIDPTSRGVFETLRMSPTTAGLTPRISKTRGIELQNHFIPPGTEIYVNLRSVNMHESIWEKPEKFQPERFMANE